MQTATNKLTERRRKSEPLTKDELKSLEKFRKTFLTELDCAEAIGVSRNVLGRIMLVGSGSPANIEKIRFILSTL